MNRRIQGKVKQAQRRAQKRRDIRAGRILSMQEYIRRTHHHEEEEMSAPDPGMVEAQVAAEAAGGADGTHELVNNETGQVLQQGTEYQMRKQRQISLEASPDGSFTVRKIKAVA